MSNPLRPTPRDVSNLDPDYIVDGLSASKMDAQGRLTHTLRAQKMTHYPDEDLTVLIEPRFVAYAEGEPPVTVTSRQARMSGNGENVYFEREVRVVRAPSGKHGRARGANEFPARDSRREDRADRPARDDP